MTLDPHPAFLRAFAETRGFLLGRPGRMQLTPDGSAVLFLRSPPRDPTLGLFEYDVARAQARELVSPAQLTGGAGELVSDEERARRERMRITERGFTAFGLSPDGTRVLLPFSGRLYLVERATGAVRALPLGEGQPISDPRFSPDGRRVAYVQGNELWVVDLDLALDLDRAAPAGARPRALTRGASEDLLHGVAEFVAQEEMGRHEGYWWSPDGACLAYAEVDQRAVERFTIADPAWPERRPQTFPYPRPGRANARVRLGVVSADPAAQPSPVTRWVLWDDQRYPYLARVCWTHRSAPLALLVQTRDQRRAAFLAVDTASGATRVLVEESDAAWVNLYPDLPAWLPDGSGFLWSSERSGSRTLELRRPDGTLEREVLAGAAEFISLVHVAPDASAALVLAGGAVGNRIERVSLRSAAGGADSRAAVIIAGETGAIEHAPIFCRDGSLGVDTRTAADAWPHSLIVRADGSAIGTLPDVAEQPPFRVNLQLVRAGGDLDFHAAVVRPRDFDSGRLYPVVVQVYGGPHALTVKADERQYLLAQWMADHGVIVVSIDNRGTPRRGRDWERAIKGSFADLALEDQVAGLRALADRFPELDLSRVGIFGWSFGGFMAALAVMRRPDIFKVAAAGAPVVDWRDYDTHYTERYLDLPDRDPEAYRRSSLLTYAAALERPLLLVHGTADDNVYFFHSLKLAGALFAAGRPFELVPLPGVTHQVPDPLVREQLWRRITDFLLHHLRGKETVSTAKDPPAGG